MRMPDETAASYTAPELADMLDALSSAPDSQALDAPSLVRFTRA